MQELTAHFKVVNGKPQWKNEEYFRTHFPTFEGCVGVLEVKRKWNQRSISQNKLLWLWYETIGEYTGNSGEEIHTILKGLHAPRKEATLQGKRYMIPRSTTTFSKGEMVEYMLAVEMEAGRMGVKLPHPEDLEMAPLMNE